MPPFAYALVVCGVLAFANWGQWQRSQALGAKAAAATLERNQAQADRDAALQSQARAEAAQRALNQTLQKLRADYEARNRKLDAVPDDGCLHRDHGGAVGDVLREPGTAAAAALADPAHAQPAAAADLPRPDLPRRD